MCKLLFVDDEKTHENLIKTCFREEIKNNKYQIKFAQNGQEAIQIITLEPPDLLLTDLRITGQKTDGFELIKLLKQKQINLKTIVISAYSELENICESVEQDVLCFVPKPFDIAGLKTLIDVALKKKEQQLLPKDQDTNDISTRTLTLTKASRVLPIPERIRLINNIIETLPTKDLHQLQETLPDFLATQIQLASERKKTLEILRENQFKGRIPQDIPLDERFIRIIKRPIKQKGVEYGPYYYIVWRDEKGKNKSKCVGTKDPLLL